MDGQKWCTKGVLTVGCRLKLPSQPADPPQSTSSGDVGFGAVDNIGGSRTVFLFVESCFGRVYSDLGLSLRPSRVSVPNLLVVVLLLGSVILLFIVNV